ncbi:hypothetical protein ACQEVZ_46695 [Dactylosporangium sp. CA-152071]|uniref:hypothetical protein n=1 Tax=Dactylosporangium sp. CA-152071 TaxID=3239933 RepID=UPI003D8BB3F3
MIERRIFGLTRTLRAAVPGDVQRILMSAEPADDPSYTWRDDDRRVAVVVSVIDANHCQVALLDGGRWHDLVDSDEPGLAWVSLTGIPGVVPSASVLPCRFAVDALETVTIGAGFDHLRASRRWRVAPAWVDDRRGYLLRDLVEVLWDAAGALPVDEPAAAAGPVGLRHLARVQRLHNRAMGGGLGAVLAEFPPDRFDAAVRGFAYLGMTDLREVLRDADDDAYERLASPDGEDAGAIRAAVQRKLDTAPWEFGVTDVPRLAGTDFLRPAGRTR